jgi:hypothetical protein
MRAFIVNAAGVQNLPARPAHIILILSHPNALDKRACSREHHNDTGLCKVQTFVRPVMLKKIPAILMSAEENTTRTFDTGQPYDKLQHFFIRPFFLSLTIGIPFCIYKALFGLAAIRVGTHATPSLAVFGFFIVVWAAIDLIMNAERAVFDLLHEPDRFEYCTLAMLGRIVKKPMLFLAIDTLLSFAIICFMLWSGWITRLTVPESWLWYAGTTLNLISLSLVSIYNEYKKSGTQG